MAVYKIGKVSVVTPFRNTLDQNIDHLDRLIAKTSPKSRKLLRALEQIREEILDTARYGSDEEIPF